jgi:glycosyl transferase family 25
MNEYFDHVYVLSLRREKKRRELITQRLGNINLKFEFFDAIDGSVMKYLWQYVSNKIINQNYMACLLSHLSIYKDALDKGYKRPLILEDDVIPKKSILEDFEKIKVQIPEDYDLLYLGYIPLDDEKICWDYRVLENRFISDNIFDTKNLWGAYAYSITPNMMEYMINVYNNDFPMELDNFFVSNHKKYYGTLPQLFCHDINVSGNSNEIDYSSIRKSIHYKYPITDYI